MNLLHANDRPGSYPDSYYAATATPLPPFAAQEGDRAADVCIIGGGFTGLSAALHLAERGYDVVLLEAHRVGWGASGRNGGQIGTGQRKGQQALERMVGLSDARALWQIAEDAKALIKALIDRHDIACDWKPGVSYVTARPGDVAEYHQGAVHLATRYDYDKIEMLDRAGARDLIGSGRFHGGILDHGAAHMHPLNFALGLARAAQAAGAHIHETSEVMRLHPGDPARVETARGTVTARHVLLACNGYLGGLDESVAARVMPINNFIVATEPLGQAGAEDLIRRDVALADGKFVVNYWRRSADHRLIFGGGETYGYRFPADIAAMVRKPMTEIYPQLKDVRIDHAWGGTLAITVNRMPCFRRVRGNVLSAGGYSGSGVAMATMAGKMMADAIAGQAERFDIMARVPTHVFPGGRLLRWPSLVAAMSFFSLRDKLGL